MGYDLMVDDLVVDEHTALATPGQFDRLLEYSCSLPTGTTEGKRWKRQRTYGDKTSGWMLGEYGPLDVIHSKVPIIWRELIVVE